MTLGTGKASTLDQNWNCALVVVNALKRMATSWYNNEMHLGMLRDPKARMTGKQRTKEFCFFGGKTAV
jgi:hypothetical protein